MTNRNLHYWRNRAHQVFDRLWKKPNAVMKRSQAYEWLALTMDLPLSEAHFSRFDIDQCKQVVELLRTPPPMHLALKEIKRRALRRRKLHLQNYDHAAGRRRRHKLQELRQREHDPDSHS